MRKRASVSLLGLVVVGLALAASTQYVAATFGFHRQLGTPLATVAGVRLYPPWAWLAWDERLHRFAPRAFAIASVVTYGALVVVIAPLVVLAAIGTRPDLTALWEAAMRRIASGHMPLGQFLAGVLEQLRKLIGAVAQRGLS